MCDDCIQFLLELRSFYYRRSLHHPTLSHWRWRRTIFIHAMTSTTGHQRLMVKAVVLMNMRLYLSHLPSMPTPIEHFALARTQFVHARRCEICLGVVELPWLSSGPWPNTPFESDIVTAWPGIGPWALSTPRVGRWMLIRMVRFPSSLWGVGT